MIKPISKMEAFELLLNKDTANKVYVKKLGTTNYLQAKNHKFAFCTATSAINVHLADFYFEEREGEYGITLLQDDITTKTK